MKIRLQRTIIPVVALGIIVVTLNVAHHFIVQITAHSKSVKKVYKDNEFRPGKPHQNEVIILHWTTWWGYHQWLTKSPKILTEKECPYLHLPAVSGQTIPDDVGVFHTCRISFDRRYFETSDAVVFHACDLKRKDIPSTHLDHQFWVYYQLESPCHRKAMNLSMFPNMFNWTMTYRRDSDINAAYGHVVPLPPTKNRPGKRLELDVTDIISKPRLVLWISSDNITHSRREELVRQLQKYIPVDIYGRLGKPCKTSSHGLNVTDCYGPLAKHYKFYLSFENSLCADYVTEKFFKALNLSMVPVVYGGTGVEDYARIAPSNSYIDWRKFKSVKELAEYLLYLDKNVDEYLNYFEWKLTYKVIETQDMCNLCQKTYTQRKLREKGQTWSPKWYGDLWKWWNHQASRTHFIVNGTENADALNERNGTQTSACTHQDFNSTYTDLLDKE